MQRSATAVLLLLAVISLSGPAPRAQDAGAPAATLRRDVTVVSVYFTVRDGKRRLVSDLPRERFQVLEDGRDQNIRYFAHHSDVPINLGVLLDTSTGLSRLLRQEADAATEFLRHVLRPNDLAFAVSYSKGINVLQGPTGQVDLLAESIQTVRHAGRAEDVIARLPTTPPFLRAERVARLYDTLRLSTARFLADEYGRKAVVVVALADDARSESSLEDALEALQGSDVTAYVLQVYDGPGDPCDIVHEYNPHYLRRLAEETGGRVVEVRGMSRLAQAFDDIAEELHNQYSLGYAPENRNFDGKFRKLEIKVRGGGYRIQARRGYFATPPKNR